MSHDEPMFGDRPTANDPEALHDSMIERGYAPWSPRVSHQDVAEIRALAGKDHPWEPGKKRREPQPLGRTGKIVAGVVAVVLLGPFAILLWHWALTLVGAL